MKTIDRQGSRGMSRAEPSLTRRRFCDRPRTAAFIHGGVFLLIMCLAAYLRLVRLGLSAFRADTMEFWKICHHEPPLSAGQIWTQWLELLGRTSQFPFTLALTKGFLDLFRLPPTDALIRLPGALFGILAIPFAYLAGKVAGGRRFGLLFALLLALNPMHIQTSREAYFYAPMLPGSVMLLWSLLFAWRYRRLRDHLPIRFYVITGCGFLLTAYSHLTGWWLCALVLPVTLVILGARALRMSKPEPSTRNQERSTRQPARSTKHQAPSTGNPTPNAGWWFRWREPIVLLMLCVIIGLPLLFEEWAVPYFYRDLTDPAIRANTVRVMGGRSEPVLQVLSGFGSGLAWGRSALRTGLTLLALFLAMVPLALRKRRRGLLLLVAALLAAGFGLCILGNRLTATRLGPRYVTAFQPMYMLLIGAGLWRVSVLWRRCRREDCRTIDAEPSTPGAGGAAGSVPGRLCLRRAPAWGLAAVAVGLLAGPAWWSTQMTGQPHPYKEIIAATNKLPPGTPVLVDRWFEPWNELRVHSSTNVHFTFTVPNEPPDVFEKVNWRATATNFLTRFPDAAYLEIRQSYADLFGPWDWPKRNFRRQVEFRDRASEKLDAIGLALRGFSRPILFYNSREDALDLARARGDRFLVWYGPGWGYHKLWPQVQDFRDWRVLRDQAQLELFNLGTDHTNATLRLRAVAVNGAKRVEIRTTDQRERTSRVFSAGQVVDWNVPNVRLESGGTKLILADPAWGQRNAVLLVEEVEIKPET